MGGETAYFGVPGLINCEVWRTDGNVASEIDANIGCGLPLKAVVGDDFLFGRSDANRHLQIYRATANDSAASSVVDLGAVSARPDHGWLANSSTGLFLALRRNDADELWHFDDATGPPALLHRFEAPGDQGLYLRQLAAVGRKIVFWVGALNGDGDGHTLWQSGGSPDSTRPVGVLPKGRRPSGVVASNSLYFFWAYDADNRATLWTIDRLMETATPTATDTPTATHTPTVTDTPTATYTPTVTPTLTSTKPPCVGDCNADGFVTVADVVGTIKVALGLSRLDTCPLIDANFDLRVSIDELVASVYSLLHDCPREAN